MLPVWSGQRDAMQGRQRQFDGGGQPGRCSGTGILATLNAQLARPSMTEGSLHV